MMMAKTEDISMKVTRSLITHGLVAVVSAAVTAFLASGATNVAAASAQPAPPGTVPLLTQALPDLPGREVRMLLLDRVPGNASPAHRRSAT
jgi:hypothetical protein